MNNPLAMKVLLLVLWGLTAPVHGRVACFSIFDCEAKVRKGSECIDGFCSNPYHRGGCLASTLPDHHRVRTCNSEDPPEAVEMGYCRKSRLDYTEVRIASQNWESVFFEAWILQILLSELLDIPTTIETGTHDANVDFYNIDMSFQYGTSNDWDAMRKAGEIKDCRKLKNQPGFNTSEGYIPCSHLVPEVWTGHTENLRKLQDDQVIDPPAGLGALGSQGWYIPRFTAQRDPTLLTYLGIMGDENREKLASTFLRPTTWGDYCADESNDNCQTPDSVASRPPVEGEEDMYFGGVDFIGHFRNTTENDCENFPDDCTGHIVDYPCGWSSFVTQQAHHLGIAVESNGKEPGSNGYSYGAMTQIWAAANATNSSVMLHWWQPEALYQEYLGTHAEFQRVSLPPPTQDCVERRVNPLDRCSDDPLVRVGEAAGACDEAPHALFKIIGSSLYDISYDPELPEALHSPAYESIKDFRISDLQLGKIFDYWFEVNQDKWNLDPRDAVCRWVIENIDQVKSFIPRNHPRLIEDDDNVYQQPIYYASVSLACISIVFSTLSIIVTYFQREKKVMKYAQIEFLFLLLVGLLLVSLGALLNALPPSNPICVSVAWLVNFGYTLELVPLIVKVAAINRLMVAAQHMRRVELKLASLYGAVLSIAILVGVGLIIWTATDPPHKSFELLLSGSQNSYGETIVERTHYCQSDNEIWYYLSVSWQLLLLLAASVLAFQTRKIREDLNETRTLAMLIYSHFVFVVLRSITQFMDSSVSKSDLAAARSIIYSADVIATIFIYFVPKFFTTEDGRSAMTAPWLKRAAGSGSAARGAASRQNTHNNWQERPSNHAVVSAYRARDTFAQETSEDSNGDVLSRHSSSFMRPVSLRQSSHEYRVQAEWEDSEASNALQVVSEEEEVDLEENEDETGSLSETQS